VLVDGNERLSCLFIYPDIDRGAFANHSYQKIHGLSAQG
jgi:hypothetical protein